jgi:hypothetical protein
MLTGFAFLEDTCHGQPHVKGDLIRTGPPDGMQASRSARAPALHRALAARSAAWWNVTRRARTGRTASIGISRDAVARSSARNGGIRQIGAHLIEVSEQGSDIRSRGTEPRPCSRGNATSYQPTDAPSRHLHKTGPTRVAEL